MPRGRFAERDRRNHGAAAGIDDRQSPPVSLVT
jgi:hypothetical protein